MTSDCDCAELVGLSEVAVLAGFSGSVACVAGALVRLSCLTGSLELGVKLGNAVT